MERGRFRPWVRTFGRTGGERAACALLAAIALAPLPALAQATGGADAEVEILDPVTGAVGADLDFGEITTTGTAGTVTIPPNPGNTSASCTTTGGLIHTGNCRAARFDGDVTVLYLLQVTRPAGNQLTLTGPMGATMVVNNLTYNMSSAALDVGLSGNKRRYLILSVSGNFTLYVGGRLNVAGDQRPGVYNGQFTLTFNYS